MSTTFKTEAAGDDIRVTVGLADFLLLQIMKTDPHLQLLTDAEVGRLVHQVDNSPWARTNKIVVASLNCAIEARKLCVPLLPVCS